LQLLLSLPTLFLQIVELTIFNPRFPLRHCSIIGALL